MTDYTSGATVPPRSQDSALPPDWHLICCEEDHGSSSRTPYQQVNNSQRDLTSKTAEGRPSVASFAWMSCCEDEACVSPPADGTMRIRQHGNPAFSGQPPKPCNYNDQVSQMYCSSDPNNGESLTSAKPFGNYAGPKRLNGIRSASRSTSRPRLGECPPDTICCDSAHLPSNSQHSANGTSMDCAEEGCCDIDEFVCQDHDMVGACVSQTATVPAYEWRVLI